MNDEDIRKRYDSENHFIDKLIEEGYSDRQILERLKQDITQWLRVKKRRYPMLGFYLYIAPILLVAPLVYYTNPENLELLSDITRFNYQNPIHIIIILILIFIIYYGYKEKRWMYGNR